MPDDEKTTLTVDELRELLDPEDLDRPMSWDKLRPLTLRELKPLYRMREEALVPWLNALLSDEFEQGMARLHAIIKRWPGNDDDELDTTGEPTSVEHRFCCLGVYCEAAIAAGVALTTKVQPSGLDVDNVTGTKDDDATVDAVVYGTTGESYLPVEVLEWGNVPECPMVDESRGYRTLATLNDNHLGFADIARVIFYLYGPDAPEFDTTNDEHRRLRGLEPLPPADAEETGSTD